MAEMSPQQRKRGWTVFKTEILKAQELALPMCLMTSQWLKRPSWLVREFILFARRSRQLRRTSRILCREKTSRDTGQVELNLATASKDDKKVFL